MSFLKKLFGNQAKPIHTYNDFWNWFLMNEKDFFKVVKRQQNIEKGFFDKLSPKLDELNDGFLFVTGMYNDETAELIITAEGSVKNMVFVEELVEAAPNIPGWKFTAHKAALDIENVNIKLEGYLFDKEKLSFYPNDLPAYPDEIDITVVHDDLTEQNKETITNGTYIFLDNYIGELNFATSIDNLIVIGKQAVEKELIPIEKLKDFLVWRKKEFIEKYDGVLLDTENMQHSVLEAEQKNGKKLIATINTDILKWENKASHPWILTVEINYDGKKNNGMPDESTYRLLNEIEDAVLKELKDYDGYLNIGRQTSNGVREIYIACKDFRKPSKVLHQVQKNYAAKIDVVYDIYVDKYWQSFNRFIPN